MKIFFVFMCVILAVIAFAKADKCEIYGHTLQVEENYSPPGKCLLITCMGPNSFSAVTCPPVKKMDTLKYIPQNNSKTYPECCPHYE